MVRHRARSGSSGDDSKSYRPGQIFLCKITNVEAGGYDCVVVKDNLPGFLPTNEHLKEGEEVMAQYLCVHNRRILLSTHYSRIQLDSSDKEQK